MKIDIEDTNSHASDKLKNFIQEKVDKLETYFSRITDAEVYLKTEKDSNNEDKVVEVKLNVPKKTLFAEEKATSFEEAVDKTVEALRRQLKKHKEKMEEHH